MATDELKSDFDDWWWRGSKAFKFWDRYWEAALFQPLWCTIGCWLTRCVLLAAVKVYRVVIACDTSRETKDRLYKLQILNENTDEGFNLMHKACKSIKKAWCCSFGQIINDSICSNSLKKVNVKHLFISSQRSFSQCIPQTNEVEIMMLFASFATWEFVASFCSQDALVINKHPADIMHPGDCSAASPYFNCFKNDSSRRTHADVEVLISSVYSMPIVHNKERG